MRFFPASAGGAGLLWRVVLAASIRNRQPITVRHPLPTIIGEVRRGNWLRRVRDPGTRRKLRRALTFGAARAGLAQPSRWILLLILLVVVATVALYFPVNHHPFVNYDDDEYVTDNVHVKAGLTGETVAWAFTTYDAANWHPLTWFSHALDYQLFQLDPAGHHDTNLLLHALNVALLFWVLWQATGYPGRSLMVAALFALHPINVESVVWVAERKNLLSMLFFLLALGAYRWYARQPRVGRYAAVTLLYVLGLLSKPQVITLPFVLLLWDYWPLRRMAIRDEQSTDASGPAATFPQRSFAWLVKEKLPPLRSLGGQCCHHHESATTGRRNQSR
jgi:hypothetical protein